MGDNIDEVLKKLDQQVSSFVGKDSTVKNKSGWIDRLLSLNIYIKFSFFPVILFIILVVFQPRFVKEDVKNDDGTFTKKLSMKKVIVTIFTITLIIVSVYFFYTLRNN